MTLKTRILLLAIIALLIFLLGGFTGYFIKRCPDCELQSVKVEYRDSIAPNKEPVRVIDTKPKKIGTKKFIPHFIEGRFTQADTSKWFEVGKTCLDTNYYKTDSLSPENFRAITTATVTGNELVDLKVVYKNLAPEKWRIETVTKTLVSKEVPSLVKVYAGTFGVGKKGYWGLGLKANVVFNDSYMLGYGFDVKNLSHQAELLIKIKLK